MKQLLDTRVDELIARCPCKLSTAVQIAPLTTFRVGGMARVLAEPSTESELLNLLVVLRDLELPYFYLGLGSNILVSDHGFKGVVIRSRGELGRIEVSGSIIKAGPAARLLMLTTCAARHSLTGLEQLSGIPGTVAGALFMNAGAYGGEISDHLVDVRIVSRDLSIQVMKKSDIAFGYRSAPELRDVIVLSSRYELIPGDRSAIYKEMRRVWQLRREKQPIAFPSAGSIFKRPPGDYAGRLIEEAGLKGHRVGGAVVPTAHAGIFINDRGAQASEIAELIRKVRSDVYRKFAVMLENEIIPVGFDVDPFQIHV